MTAERELPILDYDLPDAALLQAEGDQSSLLVWQPPTFCIVLGRGSKMELSINPDPVRADDIPIYKRPSGGETVVLSPATPVISFVKRKEPFTSPLVFFRKCNLCIVDALVSLGVENLCARGISDICIGDKKILGSSIYRNRDLVFYHAVLNLAEPVENIEKYLAHPPREPEYRAGRSHRDFVTSISAAGYEIAVERLRAAVEEAFSAWERDFEPPPGALSVPLPG